MFSYIFFSANSNNLVRNTTYLCVFASRHISAVDVGCRFKSILRPCTLQKKTMESFGGHIIYTYISLRYLSITNGTRAHAVKCEFARSNSTARILYLQKETPETNIRIWIALYRPKLGICNKSCPVTFNSPAQKYILYIKRCAKLSG